MSVNLGPLFEPFEYKTLHLRNRVAMAPMTRNFSPGRVPGENVAGYYRRRAEGGVGLLITEGTTINHVASNGYPDVPAFFGEEALAGWKRVVDEVPCRWWRHHSAAVACRRGTQGRHGT